MKIVFLLGVLCITNLFAVTDGQIIDPDNPVPETVPKKESTEPVSPEKKDNTPVVTQEIPQNHSRIECENDPKEFFTLYPESPKFGTVRLSSGVEPVFKGFFSYAFTYDVMKTKKGAIYLSLNRDTTAFQEIAVPLYADGSNNEIRLRLVDKDGEVFTTVLGKIVLNWKDEWRTVALTPADFEFTDWAETNAVNKVMDYPVIIQKIYFVHMKGGMEKGIVFLDDIIIR